MLENVAVGTDSSTHISEPSGGFQLENSAGLFLCSVPFPEATFGRNSKVSWRAHPHRTELDTERSEVDMPRIECAVVGVGVGEVQSGSWLPRKQIATQVPGK
jgi:hypothetical protein